MQKPLTLGIAGLGTVGAGLLELLHEHWERLAERAGRPIKVAGVSARTQSKKRGIDIAGVPWFDDPVRLSRMPGGSFAAGCGGGLAAGTVTPVTRPSRPAGTGGGVSSFAAERAATPNTERTWLGARLTSANAPMASMRATAPCLAKKRLTDCLVTGFAPKRREISRTPRYWR